MSLSHSAHNDAAPLEAGDRVTHPEFHCPGTIERFFESDRKWCVVYWDDDVRRVHPIDRLTRIPKENQ